MVVGTPNSHGKYKAIASVEFGFKPEEKTAFRQIARQIVIKEERNIICLEQVQYLERKASGSLRIASFKGFNLDNLATT